MVLSVACGLFVAADIAAGRRNKMTVMNFVWPLTVWWAGPLGLALYFLTGRRPPNSAKAPQKKRHFPFQF